MPTRKPTSWHPTLAAAAADPHRPLSAVGAADADAAAVELHWLHTLEVAAVDAAATMSAVAATEGDEPGGAVAPVAHYPRNSNNTCHLPLPAHYTQGLCIRVLGAHCHRRFAAHTPSTTA